jgi:uncharacterized membrane protein
LRRPHWPNRRGEAFPARFLERPIEASFSKQLIELFSASVVAIVPDRFTSQMQALHEAVLIAAITWIGRLADGKSP